MVSSLHHYILLCDTYNIFLINFYNKAVCGSFRELEWESRRGWKGCTWNLMSMLPHEGLGFPRRVPVWDPPCAFPGLKWGLAVYTFHSQPLGFRWVPLLVYIIFQVAMHSAPFQKALSWFHPEALENTAVSWSSDVLLQGGARAGLQILIGKVMQ